MRKRASKKTAARFLLIIKRLSAAEKPRFPTLSDSATQQIIKNEKSEGKSGFHANVRFAVIFIDKIFLDN
ncbi:MAG: hypothetical protein Q8M94_06195, partial [Ignavibacteria bacterium]|nr:hypothetical protein [Ignavibacteria bacterium]